MERKSIKQVMKKITFIPDEITMLQQMRIEEAMEFMKDFYTSWNQKRADEMLHFFRLEKNRQNLGIVKRKSGKSESSSRSCLRC